MELPQELNKDIDHVDDQIAFTVFQLKTTKRIKYTVTLIIIKRRHQFPYFKKDWIA